MPHPLAAPATPGEPAWDIACTRLTQSLRPRVAACMGDLARRFQAIGLAIDTQVRPTPRGLSTFLALVGQRGLICIVDLTLVDGMAVGQGRRVALDLRLLDACGDVVADGLASDVRSCSLPATSATAALQAEAMERAATAVYVATLAHFELLRPAARPA